MSIAEFKEEFLNDVRAYGIELGTGTTAAFTSKMADYLIEGDIMPSFESAYYKGKYGRRNFRVDGYTYDELDDTLNLIIADFDSFDLDRHLTQSKAAPLFQQVTTFVEMVKETKVNVEISTPVYDLVDLLRSKDDRIRRYRVFLFTNAEMSSNIKKLDNESWDDIPVERQIWDISRIQDLISDDVSGNDIEIDFTQYCPNGIPCLEASDVSNEQYKSYLGVIPGRVLADIYDQYGSHLLEGNVRSFLSSKRQVNKQIRRTIMDDPTRFFIYNNGIACTAVDVEVKTSGHGLAITKVRNFQIINGGQTTASLSNTRHKDKASLSDIYVQMKLTAINEAASVKKDDVDNLVRNISRCSNSQNKVSEADFFASHPFHQQMEKISRNLQAPPVGGAQYGTKWFYERARGQYLQAQMRMTKSEKNHFLARNPKDQKITKTDLAKYQNTWNMLPHIVSKGAETNFKYFAEVIDTKWNEYEDSKNKFNERYYQSTVAIMIMFKYLEKVIPKQSWYAGGYRANVIYYTIALFHKLIKEQFKPNDLDLGLIWARQSVPDIVAKELLKLAEKVHQSITSDTRTTINVTQWCKQEKCWSIVKTISHTLPIDDLKHFILSKEDAKSAEKQARKDQKIDAGIDSQTAVFKIDYTVWPALMVFLKKNPIASPSDEDVVRIMTRVNSTGKIPNSYQCDRLLKLLKKAEDEGFRFERK